MSIFFSRFSRESNFPNIIILQKGFFFFFQDHEPLISIFFYACFDSYRVCVLIPSIRMEYQMDLCIHETVLGWISEHAHARRPRHRQWKAEIVAARLSIDDIAKQRRSGRCPAGPGGPS